MLAARGGHGRRDRPRRAHRLRADRRADRGAARRQRGAVLRGVRAPGHAGGGLHGAHPGRGRVPRRQLPGPAGRRRDDRPRSPRTGRASRPDGDGFAQLLRAEWTKFRTVRGWVIGMIVAALVIAALGLFAPAGSSSCQARAAARRGPASGAVPAPGPGGEAVHRQLLLRAPAAGRQRQHHRPGDLADRPDRRDHLAGHGPARRPRPRAAGPRPGSSSRRAPGRDRPYAAMMVTGGHGVRMQYDYTSDIGGPAGRRLRGVPAVAAADPVRRHAHRLRLGRRHALDPGRHRAPGRAAGDRAGRAVRRLARHYAGDLASFGGGTSGSSPPSQATAVFDHVSRRARWPGGTWTGDDIGAADGSAELGGYPPGRRPVHRDRVRRHRPGRRPAAPADAAPPSRAPSSARSPG